MTKIKQTYRLDDGRNICYAEYGDLNGYPIVYFHGSQSSRLEMHYDLSFALNNNLRIITIDRPGHGFSDFNSMGTIKSFCNDVASLMKYLSFLNYSVVGMSAGAPFALGMGAFFSNEINEVAIISGFIPLTKDSKKFLTKEVRLLLDLAKTFPFLLRIMLKLQSKQVKKSPQKALKNFLSIMSESDQKVLENSKVLSIIENMFVEAFQNGSNGIAYEISKVLVQDWAFNLNEIEVPVSLWYGEKDCNVPYQWGQLIEKEIKECNLTIYPNEGHLIIFNHAEEIFKRLKK